MSVKEVTQLRKNGNLKEAYRLAHMEWRADPGNPWTRMSLFWVLRDICTIDFLPQGNIDKAKEALDFMRKLLPHMMDTNGAGKKAYVFLLKSLNPEADQVAKALQTSKTDAKAGYELAKEYIVSSQRINESLHEDLGWVLYRYMKEVYESVPSIEIRRLLKYYMDLRNKRPSLLHSCVLNFALGFSKDHTDFKFYTFFCMWGPDYLRPEDFQDGLLDGHKISSLISRVCRSFATHIEEIDLQRLYDSVSAHQKQVMELIREPLFWEIWDLHKEKKMDDLVKALMKYARKFSPFGSSHWHSEVLKTALFAFDESANRTFLNFFREWDVKNLSYEDWNDTKDADGNTYPSIAVKAAKRCFDCVKAMPIPKTEDVMRWLADFYKEVVSRNRSDLWLARDRALLLSWLNSYEEAIPCFKRLLLSMGEKYYLWSELADCVVDDVRLKMGLLSKALLLERNESFLGDIHLELAALLIGEKLYDEALYELDRYKAEREKNSWNLSSKYTDLMALVPSSSVSPKNNMTLYHKFIPQAEEFVYSEIPTAEVVLLDRWEKEGKTRCAFSDGKKMNFQVNAKRFPFLQKAKLGAVFSVKCYEEPEKELPNGTICYGPLPVKEPKYILLMIRKTEKKDWSALPLNYGVVDFVNTEKRAVHIINSEMGLVFYHYKDTCNWKKGDFLSFRTYFTKQKDEKKVQLAEVTRCEKEAAIGSFDSRIVVVDNVNEPKRIIHYEMGPNLTGGIISFDETDLRPEEGDLLEISYYVKKNKEGKERKVVLSIEPTDKKNEKVKVSIKGFLSFKYKVDYYMEGEEPDFAFIDDYYVHRSVLRKFNIDSEQYVNADAIYAGNGKWKVVKIY